MKTGLAIFAIGWATALLAFTVDVRTPEEIARDRSKAQARKEKLSRKVDQLQITEALRQATREIGIIDGVDLSQSKIDSDWDWGWEEPHTPPSCGAWVIEADYGRWGRPKSLKFTLDYKKDDNGQPDGRFYFIFIEFKLQKKSGRFIAQFSDFGNDEWIILCMGPKEPNQLLQAPDGRKRLMPTV